MTLGRREFLQRLGAALAVLGISDSALAGLGNTYQQALANAPRRLALLVGIDRYPDAVLRSGASSLKGAALQGAATDVALQQELLTHRFGVPATDILTLTNDQATRQAILDAVQSHFAEQAKPGDTLLFHFSGLGSQVHLADQPANKSLPTLVAFDSKLPQNEQAILRDLFEETLAEALAAIPGVQVITVLDASGAAPLRSPWQGNFRVRSRLHVPVGTWNADIAAAYDEPRKVVEKVSETWPGLLMRAARPGMPALEGTWKGFSAGVFTYALTQQIWHSFAPQQRTWVFYRVQNTMYDWTGTAVSAAVRGQQASKDKSGYLLPLSQVARPCDAVTQRSHDDATQSATLWLGGLMPELLPFCALGLRLKPIATANSDVPVPASTLMVKELSGLTAQAAVQPAMALPAGLPLVEIERRLPADIPLTVALDPALERIERVDATSALAGLAYITTAVPGEQWADCIFGRFTAQASAASPLSAVGQSTAAIAATTVDAQPGFSLFAPGYTLLPGTATEIEEAVKTAVGRLSPSLRSLLAVKLLRLTLNASSSQLPYRLMLERLTPTPQVVRLEETVPAHQRATEAARQARLAADPNTLETDQRFRIRLLNLGDQPLYYLIVNVAKRGNISVYCPFLEAIDPANGTQPNTDRIAQESQLSPQGQLQFPRLEDDTLSLQQLQSADIFAIVCTQPFTETWRTIQAANFRQPSDRLAMLADPLPVMRAVLHDIHRAGVDDSTVSNNPPESVLALKSHTWATLVLHSVSL